jgi:hypothetical protein
MGISEAPSGHNRDALFTKPRFGSTDTEDAWKKKCKAARVKQKVRIAVAPDCFVETVGGVKRCATEELTQAEVGGRVNLEQLEKVGVVICLSESEFKINNGTARHVIGRKAIIGSKKIHDVGEVVEASDFDRADDPAFSYTNTQGHHKEAEAVTYPSGEETLRRLVKNGFVQEMKTRAAVQKAIKAARGE